MQSAKMPGHNAGLRKAAGPGQKDKRQRGAISIENEESKNQHPHAFLSTNIHAAIAGSPGERRFSFFRKRARARPLGHGCGI